MGGDSGGGTGGGGGIINDALLKVISAPEVWSKIPVAMKGSLEPFLSKPRCDWSDHEERTFCNVLNWAVMSGK